MRVRPQQEIDERGADAKIGVRTPEVVRQVRLLHRRQNPKNPSAGQRAMMYGVMDAVICQIARQHASKHWQHGSLQAAGTECSTPKMV